MRPIKLLLLLAVLLPLGALGGSGSWSGDQVGNWSDVTKWVGGAVADGADYTAGFVTNITLARTVTLDSGRSIGHLTFQDTASGYFGWVLAGTNILTLDVGGGQPQISVNTAGGTAGATISLILAGSDGLAKQGPGPLVLSGANTFSGGVTVNQGTLTVTADNNLGAASNDVTFTGSAQLTARGFTTARNLVINSGVTATSSVAGVFSVGGSISGGGTLYKVNTGVLALLGTNTHGATVIAGGELRGDDGVGVSSGNVNILGGGIWSTGADITRALGSGSNQVQLAGPGGFSAYGGPVAVDLGDGGEIIAWGSGAFGTPAPFYLNSATANARLTLRNAINLNSNTAQIAVLADVAEIAGVISNSAAGLAGLTKTGAGVLWLTATNAFPAQSRLTAPAGCCVRTMASAFPLWPT